MKTWRRCRHKDQNGMENMSYYKPLTAKYGHLLDNIMVSGVKMKKLLLKVAANIFCKSKNERKGSRI